MAPTIQSNNANDRDRKQRPGDKRSDLVCRVKYCNTLPDIPFDPKFITYPFLPNRFVEYKPTSLERNYKHDLLTEHDLGVTIDLINPDTYAIDPEVTLHPDDERLLEEDTLTPQDSKRSRHHNKAVPWMKKTEYISNEFNRYGNSSEKTETKVGYNVKKLLKEDDVYMNRESRIDAINKTFDDAKVPIEKHYTKPNVHAVEEFPVFPDFQLWRYPFAQVMFDTEPAPNSEAEKMSQAMIRGVMDESGEQFVAYFLPTDETVKKRKLDTENGVEYDDDAEYEYKMAREYNWNVKNKASKGYEENYFVVFRDGSVYYNELETRVRLSKRRLKLGVQPSNSKLIVRHRTLTETEFKTQELRMMQLEQPEEEEEETQENKEKDDEAEAEENENENGDAEENENENGDAEENENENGDAEASDEEKASSASSESEDGNKKEESDKEEESEEEEKEKDDDKASVKSSSSSKSSKSAKSKSSSSSSSSKSSSSSSSSESEAEETAQNKRDEEEIFGSDSD